MVYYAAMDVDLVLRRVRRPELVRVVIEEARRLRKRACEARQRALVDPPAGVDPEWWDEQARVVGRALDGAAQLIEAVAHLPPQVDPIDDEPPASIALGSWESCRAVRAT